MLYIFQSNQEELHILLYKYAMKKLSSNEILVELVVLQMMMAMFYRIPFGDERENVLYNGFFIHSLLLNTICTRLYTLSQKL